MMPGPRPQFPPHFQDGPRFRQPFPGHPQSQQNMPPGEITIPLVVYSKHEVSAQCSASTSCLLRRALIVNPCPIKTEYL